VKFSIRLLIAALLTATVAHALNQSDVPDTGSSIGLVVVGLVVLAVMRRKLFK
jgi:hypothetical protein